MDGVHDGDLHSRSELEPAARAVLVEHHQPRWQPAPGLHCVERLFGHQPMTTVQAALIRDRLADLVRQDVARDQANGSLPAVAMPEVTIERPAKAEQGDFATSFALRAKRAVGPRGPNPMEIAGAINAQIAADPPSYLAISEAAPPGPVHIGTARNAALGDSIARLLARAGWQVQREYYYNDAGTQMEHLAHSVWVRYQQALGRDVQLANVDYGGEYVVELAQEILQTHGERFADVPENRAE